MNHVDLILKKLDQGKRIEAEDALILLHDADLMEIADSANKKRWELHPEPAVTFVVDRNINYTNICISECKFCAFYRREEQDGGYVITRESLAQKIEETISLGGTQILLQGGMNPALDIDYYVDLLKFIKENFPIHIHGFSPPEIFYISQKNSISVEKVIGKLIDAGLGSIPGGGAEILVDEVRSKVSPNKCSADNWIDVMRKAHLQGLKSSATMMFGHVENEAQIIEHLMRIRALQDETGGFTAFIPWTFQPDNTRIDLPKKDSFVYLKVLALSRLVLDNIPNVQASWVTQGDKIAQSALFFGANDMGSTMIEENVVAAAGVDYMLPKEELIRLIQNAGFQAKQRDCFYNIIKKHE